MESLKLELTHQNGEKSELIPLSFKYAIDDYNWQLFDLKPYYAQKTGGFEDIISNFRRIFKKLNSNKNYQITSFICKFNKKDKIYNIFKVISKKKEYTLSDFISSGKIQIKNHVFKKFSVICDFDLYQCFPAKVDYKKSTVEISIGNINMSVFPEELIEDENTALEIIR